MDSHQLVSAGWALITMVIGTADVFHTFAIMEKEDVFKKNPCPAFLMFENAAYLADMSFELPCKCKPEEITTVVWYFQKSMGSQQTKVLTDFDGTLIVDSRHIKVGSDMLRRFSIRMFSLIVFRIQVEDSGHYICGTKKGDFFYGYDIDVQPSRRITVAFADEGQHPQNDLHEANFTVFTIFWDWTKCNRCDVRGEQRRIGLCYIKSPSLFRRYHTTIEEVASCGSKSVPKNFFHGIQMRKPEVVIRSCMVSCKRKIPSNEGEASISNIISKLGEKPWISNIPIQFHKQSLGRGLIITCPGTRPEHAVAWDKDSTRLYLSRFLTGVNKTMRVFIDHGNHLHIRFTQMNDKGIYYCWREGEIVAGFRLSVVYESRHRRSLDDPESIFLNKQSKILLTISQQHHRRFYTQVLNLWPLPQAFQRLESVLFSAFSWKHCKDQFRYFLDLLGVLFHGYSSFLKKDYLKDVLELMAEQEQVLFNKKETELALKMDLQITGYDME